MSFRGKAALACLLALMIQSTFASTTAAARGISGRDINLAMNGSNKQKLACSKMAPTASAPRATILEPAMVKAKANNVFGKIH